MTEEWRDVVGYEGLYQVSNFGMVKSNYTMKVLRPNIMHKGYSSVELFKNKLSKRTLIHRLVAYAFIPNPDGLPQINHIDENPANNHVSNLEWCTAKYNMNYGNGAKTRSLKINYKAAAEKMRISQIGAGNNNATPVLQYDKQGNYLAEFSTTKEAAVKFGKNSNHIPEVCRGKMKSAYGYVWKYKEVV